MKFFTARPLKQGEPAAVGVCWRADSINAGRPQGSGSARGWDMQFKRWMMGIRGKLIAIFVVIKVLPLLLLALVAWTMAQRLGDTVTRQAGAMADSMLATIRQMGDAATGDAIKALDDRAGRASNA